MKDKRDEKKDAARKGREDEERKVTPAQASSNGPNPYARYDFEAPEESIAVGDSYLYRPGDQKYPGTFTKEKDSMGRPLAGSQAGKPHCGWLPIQGWLIREVVREGDTYKNDDGTPKEWAQFEFLLTRGCVALDGDSHRECAPGEMVLVKASGNLKQKLREAAIHPSVVTEFYCRPTGEFVPMKDADKNPMRKWETRAVQTKARGEVLVPRLALPPSDPTDFDPKQLGAGSPS